MLHCSNTEMGTRRDVIKGKMLHCSIMSGKAL